MSKEIVSISNGLPDIDALGLMVPAPKKKTDCCPTKEGLNYVDILTNDGKKMRVNIPS